MGEPIFLSNVRCSFPHLKAPHAMQPGLEAKFQIDLLLSPNDPGWQEIMKRVQEVAVAKYAEHATQMLQIINGDRMKRCYGDGAEKINKKTMQPYAGYDGCMYLSVKSKNRPQLMKADGSKVDTANDMAYTQEAGKIYGGCFVNAAVDLYTSKQNDGVFGGLLGIQFAQDGESFGEGTPDVSGMFGQTSQPAAAPAAAPSMPGAPFAPPKTPDFMGGND